MTMTFDNLSGFVERSSLCVRRGVCVCNGQCCDRSDPCQCVGCERSNSGATVEKGEQKRVEVNSYVFAPECIAKHLFQPLENICDDLVELIQRSTKEECEMLY
eukprot:m.18063 g.18063  ORF g.18063 m.18063 type:complete len:103 (+) comp4893_c0_seq2:94-402(+)